MLGRRPKLANVREIGTSEPEKLRCQRSVSKVPLAVRTAMRSGSRTATREVSSRLELDGNVVAPKPRLGSSGANRKSPDTVLTQALHTQRVRVLDCGVALRLSPLNAKCDRELLCRCRVGSLDGLAGCRRRNPVRKPFRFGVPALVTQPCAYASDPIQRRLLRLPVL